MVVACFAFRTVLTLPPFLNHVYPNVQVREMVENGQMDVSTIDARVRDVLRVKFELGLFDTLPVADPAASDGVVHSDAHAEVAKEAARESLVRFGWLGHRVLVGTQLTRPLFPPHSLCCPWLVSGIQW